MVNSILFDLVLLIPPVTKRISYVSSILFELHRDKNTSWRIYVISRTDLGKDTFQRFYNNKLGHSHWGGRAKWNEGGNCHSWQSKCLTHLGSCCSPALPLVWTRLSLISGEDGGWTPLLGAARSQGPNAFSIDWPSLVARLLGTNLICTYSFAIPAAAPSWPSP